MKALTNCNTCRKQIIKQAQDEYLKQQYRIYTDVAHTFACFATAAVLMAQVRRGRSKQYIRKLFDDLVMIFDTPNIFGKSIDLPDVMHRLEKEYDIDFHRIHVCLETESQFIKSAKGAAKE